MRKPRLIKDLQFPKFLKEYKDINVNCTCIDMNEQQEALIEDLAEYHEVSSDVMLQALALMFLHSFGGFNPMVIPEAIGYLEDTQSNGELPEGWEMFREGYEDVRTHS